MKRLWKRIKLALGIGHKHFVWFDLERHNCYEIDPGIAGPDGEPYPPVDCIRAPVGAKVKIYRSKKRGTLHGCIGGRAVKHDAVYGLHCDSDFCSDLYDEVGTFLVSR